MALLASYSCELELTYMYNPHYKKRFVSGAFSGLSWSGAACRMKPHLPIPSKSIYNITTRHRRTGYVIFRSLI